MSDELDSLLPVVVDETNVCPYLPDQMARMPLRIPSLPVSPSFLDRILAEGYRRSGRFFYRTQCAKCQACEAIRLELAKFRPSRSQRRAEKLGDRELQFQVALPQLDAQRVLLFNKHRAMRNLDHGGPPIDSEDYEGFLLNSPASLLEISFWLANRLIAISITDVGEESLSAVYCFFDPDYSHLSPGTYAIMKQVELARKHGLKYVYLGLYVAENRHLNYKGRYLPHQRLQAGQWRDFT